MCISFEIFYISFCLSLAGFNQSITYISASVCLCLCVCYTHSLAIEMCNMKRAEAHSQLHRNTIVDIAESCSMRARKKKKKNEREREKEKETVGEIREKGRKEDSQTVK